MWWVDLFERTVGIRSRGDNDSTFVIHARSFLGFLAKDLFICTHRLGDRIMYRSLGTRVYSVVFRKGGKVKGVTNTVGTTFNLSRLRYERYTAHLLPSVGWKWPSVLCCLYDSFFVVVSRLVLSLKMTFFSFSATFLQSTLQ